MGGGGKEDDDDDDDDDDDEEGALPLAARPVRGVRDTASGMETKREESGRPAGLPSPPLLLLPAGPDDDEEEEGAAAVGTGSLPPVTAARAYLRGPPNPKESSSSLSLSPPRVAVPTGENW